MSKNHDIRFIIKANNKYFVNIFNFDQDLDLSTMLVCLHKDVIFGKPSIGNPQNLFVFQINCIFVSQIYTVNAIIQSYSRKQFLF